MCSLYIMAILHHAVTSRLLCGLTLSLQSCHSDVNAETQSDCMASASKQQPMSHNCHMTYDSHVCQLLRISGISLHIVSQFSIFKGLIALYVRGNYVRSLAICMTITIISHDFACRLSTAILGLPGVTWLPHDFPYT